MGIRHIVSIGLVLVLFLLGAIPKVDWNALNPIAIVAMVSREKPAGPSFEKEVEPILLDHCYDCPRRRFGQRRDRVR